MIRITEVGGEVVSEYPTREAALAYIGDVILQEPVPYLPRLARGWTREAIWRKHSDGGGMHTGYLLTLGAPAQTETPAAESKGAR